MQNRFFRKKFKKFVYYNEELAHKFKFQTQLFRKLQRFKTCRKNKKCSIFHELSEYIIFHMIVNYWTGPLKKFNFTAEFFQKVSKISKKEKIERFSVS